MSRAAILVTGGAGFIGSHTAVALSEAGFDVVVFDNFSTSKRRVVDALRRLVAKDCTLSFVEGDVRDVTLLHETMSRMNVVAVIHFAAFKSVAESVSNPLKYFDNNVNGLVCLLEAMRRAELHRLVFSSSCTVYGDTKDSPIAEHAPMRYINPYGQTKVIGEQILESLTKSSSQWRVVSLRYFNPIGAHPSGLLADDPVFASPNALPALLRVASGEQSSFLVFGDDYDTEDGSAVRDYIHVMDLAASHVCALDLLVDRNSGLCVENQSDNLIALNVGLGQGVSVLELVHEFERASCMKIVIEKVHRRSGDAAQIFCDTKKIRQVLPQWQPQFSVADACSHALLASEAWLKSD